MPISFDLTPPTARSKEHHNRIALEEMRPISRRYDEEEHQRPKEWVDFWWNTGRHGSPDEGLEMNDGFVQLRVKGFTNRIDPFETDPMPSAVRQFPDDANDADVAFLRDMIDSLEAGKSLTVAALDPGTEAGEDVARLARVIGEDDGAWIVQMAEVRMTS